MTKVPAELKKAFPAAKSAMEPWQALRTEMDRPFDRHSGGFGLPTFIGMFDFEPTWTELGGLPTSVPAVDVIEDEKTYKVVAELPGMEDKDVAAAITGDILTIKGEKRAEKVEKYRNYYVAERSYGMFQRSFVVPDGVDRDAFTAKVAEGVLTVTLPKIAKAQKEQKRIEVKAAA